MVGLKLEASLRESFDISERTLEIERKEMKLRPKTIINCSRRLIHQVNVMNKNNLNMKTYYDVRN